MFEFKQRNKEKLNKQIFSVCKRHPLSAHMHHEVDLRIVQTRRGEQESTILTENRLCLFSVLTVTHAGCGLPQKHELTGKTIDHSG